MQNVLAQSSCRCWHSLQQIWRYSKNFTGDPIWLLFQILSKCIAKKDESSWFYWEHFISLDICSQTYQHQVKHSKEQVSIFPESYHQSVGAKQKSMRLKRLEKFGMCLNKYGRSTKTPKHCLCWYPGKQN